jgi:hypothetical protein
MKLAKVLCLLVGLSVSSVYGADAKSEIYNQPKGGSSDLTVGYTMGKVSFDSKTSGVKTAGVEVNTSVIDFIYLYGLSDDMAFGASVDNGTLVTTVTPVSATAYDNKYTGMGDLTLKFVAFSDQGSMKVRYGADLGFSPGNAKGASTTVDGNRYSGGMSLAPYGALEMGDSNFHYGLGLSYSFLMTRKSDDTATPAVTSDITGGNVLTLSPYLETMAGPGLLSAQILLTSTGKTTTTTSGTSADTDASSSTGLALFYGYDFNPSFTLIGNLAYTKSSLGGSGTADKADATSTAYGVAGRFTF